MSDEFLSRPGAKIAYDVSGDGPIVVQLHGLSSSRGGDAALGVDFGVLARKGHRLVRYDARGHGASTGRPVPDDYRWTNLADDLIALLDALGARQPVDAIGESMGTGTILTAAVGHPERFRRMVLRIPPTAWEARAAQAGMYEQMANLLDSKGIKAVMAAMGAVPLPPVLAQRHVVMTPHFVPELASSVLRGSAASNLPPAEAIAQLRIPTLILPWIGDPGHPLSTAQRLHELIPGSEMVVAERGTDVDLWPERVAAFLA
jgi:pimeloyl-ACP methyl ester carboxylesterase